MRMNILHCICCFCNKQQLHLLIYNTWRDMCSNVAHCQVNTAATPACDGVVDGKSMQYWNVTYTPRTVLCVWQCWACRCTHAMQQQVDLNNSTNNWVQHTINVLQVQQQLRYKRGYIWHDTKYAGVHNWWAFCAECPCAAFCVPHVFCIYTHTNMKYRKYV